MDGFLHLESGDIFKGKWVTTSPAKDIDGEIVFFTGMTGYQEVLTDPSYKDQILVFTYPLIGNYGINEEDFESSKPHVAGVVVFEANDNISHYRAKYSLKDYLQKWNIPLLAHIDTRAVVKKIRNQGSMPASLSTSNSPKEISLSKDQKVEKVSEPTSQWFGEKGDSHVVLMDFGNKKSILTSLLKRNCQVTVVPYDTNFKEIQSLKPDGILLSNGPGDPKELKHVLPTIKKLLLHYPTLGICLGHQLAALALGADTKKLLFGHRGANHPIKDQLNQRVFMSSQNHSYVVDEESLKGTGFKVRYKNLHDQSIEGLTHTNLPVQTVQFHPEANPGPGEGDYIFDEFLNKVNQYSGRVTQYA
ncbi:carbamoyl phosphate synthase small subunit [Bacillus massilinigeriensis]|uniref:carbamoyl phosphate synthase small subunit n=1 Tax=Bacillus massilionigeriensis TaxID=1805475 RepID=UPI00096AE03D|nr:carbamoyl phosphate synthase small subunit [Bacillus massilionigeriensis]